MEGMETKKIFIHLLKCVHAKSYSCCIRVCKLQVYNIVCDQLLQLCLFM